MRLNYNIFAEVETYLRNSFINICAMVQIYLETSFINIFAVVQIYLGTSLINICFVVEKSFFKYLCSGAGKTSLLRVLRGLWPGGQGVLSMVGGDQVGSIKE